jgi:sensor histidine kinase YesM
MLKNTFNYISSYYFILIFFFFMLIFWLFFFSVGRITERFSILFFFSKISIYLFISLSLFGFCSATGQNSEMISELFSR